MKNILLNGLLAGIVYIVVVLAIHFINPSLNFNFTVTSIFTAIIYLFFLIRAGFQQRKRLGGFLGFGEVFVPSIAIYAIGSLIGLIFTIIMLTTDPEFAELMRETSKEAMERTLKVTGMSEDQIALEMEKANENQKNDVTSLSTLFVGWLISIIVPGLIYALIASLITKKKDKSIAN